MMYISVKMVKITVLFLTGGNTSLPIFSLLGGHPAERKLEARFSVNNKQKHGIFGYMIHLV